MCLLFVASTGIFTLLALASKLPTRAFNLAALILLTRGYELVTREFELVIRGFEAVTSGLELVIRKFELVTRRFELANCKI